MASHETWAALAEYEDMLGPQRVAVIYDWTIRRYRRCKLQPLRTHRDRVTPAQPDAMIEEPEHEEEQSKPPNVVAIEAARMKRHAENHARMVEYLQTYGPMSVGEMVRDLGISKFTVQQHLNANRDTFCVVAYVVRAGIWGLVGVHDATG